MYLRKHVIEFIDTVQKMEKNLQDFKDLEDRLGPKAQQVQQVIFLENGFVNLLAEAIV